MTTTNDTHEEMSLLERLARHKTGLAALSFGESTILPIPLETVAAPLMVGHPGRAFSIAMSIWLGCLAGALLFYFLGAWLAEPLVRPALETLGLLEQFEGVTERLGEDGLFWAVLLTSLSPVPMQLATLGAGAAGGNIVVFLAAIAISRGVRYFGLALLAQLIGPRIAQMNIPKRILLPGMIAVLVAIWAIAQLVM